MACGQPLDAFWDATPRDVYAAAKGARLRHEAERDRALLTGWTAAYLSRVNEMPDLDEVMSWFRPQAEQKQMSNDDMIRAMRQWVVATGGTLADPELAAAAGVGVTPKEDAT